MSERVDPAPYGATDATRDSGWDRLLEAGWLAAVASVPVFFNAYTMRAFEPDKAAVLRAIALFMTAAWLGRSLAHLTRGQRQPGPVQHSDAVSGNAAVWVLALSLAVFAWTGATVAFSVAPGLSLGGSYHRDQGLDTLAALLVVFVSMATRLRARAQAERVVSALLIASCPIAVYALVQYAALDPVPWAATSARPVMSTMGNALFLAGFLVMLVPLSAWRLGRAVAALVDEGPRRWHALGIAGAGAAVSLGCWAASPTVGAISALALLGGWLAVGVLAGRRLVAGVAVATYSTLLALQVGAILLSASRGPFLGLLCGGFAYACLIALAQRSRRAVLGLACLGVGVAAVFALVRLPDSPLRAVQEDPIAGRLTNVLDTGGTGQVRLLLWQQAQDALAADPARALIGHGPETTRLVLAPHYAPELGQVEDRKAEPDRAHNETLDRLLTVGLIGTVLYYATLIGLVWLGLRLGGAVSPTVGPGVPIVAGATVALLSSTLVGWLDESWRLVGLAVPLGLLAGVILCAAWRTLIRGGSPACSYERAAPPDPLALALTAGLICHVVEIQFGIATVSATLCFWAFAGLLVALARRSPPLAAEQMRPPGPETREITTVPNEFPPAVISFGLVVLSFSFGFVSAGVVPAEDPSYAWLLRVSFLVCGLMILVATWRPGTGSPAGLRILEVGAYHVSVFLAALLLGRLAGRWSDTVLPGPAAPITAYFALLLLGVILLAATLGRVNGIPGDPRRAVIWLILLTVTMPAVWWSSIRPLQADVALKRGVYAIGRSDRAAPGLAALEQAHRLAPRQDHYLIYLARGLAEIGARTESSAERDALFGRAETLLIDARERLGRDPGAILELARIQARWANLTTDPEARAGRLDRALASFRSALAVSPGRPMAWNAYGRTLATANRGDEALASIERSMSLDPRFPATYLLGARIHAELGRPDDAIALLKRGAEEAEPSAPLHGDLAARLAALGRDDEAAREYSAALAINPRHRASYAGLVGVQLRAGDCQAAVATVNEMETRLPRDPALARLRKTIASACSAAEVP